MTQKKIAEEAEARGIKSKTPVSYTHLDVYKRQVQKFKLLESEFPIRFTFLHGLTGKS